MSTLRNDIEGAPSPLGIHIPGSVPPHIHGKEVDQDTSMPRTSLDMEQEVIEKEGGSTASDTDKKGSWVGGIFFLFCIFFRVKKVKRIPFHMMKWRKMLGRKRNESHVMLMVISPWLNHLRLRNM